MPGSSSRAARSVRGRVARIQAAIPSTLPGEQGERPLTVPGQLIQQGKYGKKAPEEISDRTTEGRELMAIGALRASGAEFIATLLFVFLGAGSVLANRTMTAADVDPNVAIALAHGLAMTILVFATLNISGAHINPAVTVVLVFVIFATTDEARGVGNLAPLAIGFAILVGHLVAVPVTGASMNPARSFGPALVAGAWSDHWVYWLGPCLAAPPPG